MAEDIKETACIIGTAGHIDHGKTSLVKALTGIDTDRLIEEKKRGVSIDLGFAHLDFESEGSRMRAAIIDVPGHERFIKNMLAGTTGIDIVLFVVAADDGVMPQTSEHFDIVRLLGIKKGIFVITKADLVESNRVAEVRGEVEGLIKGSALEGSPIIPASAITGMGLENIRNEIKRGIMEAARVSIEGRFRLPVDRSFAVKGFGAVVTGTVASGSVKENDGVFIYPQGTSVKVRGIQSLYLKRERVSTGERAALNLSGVGHNEIIRGNVLASVELLPFSEFARSGKRMLVDCFFEWLPGVKVKNRLLKVHHQADEALCEVRFPDKETAGFGRLALKKPLLMLSGDRFIIRDPSINSTIGGGTVFIPYIAEVRKLDKAAIPDKADPLGALRYILNEKAGMEKPKALLMLNLSEDGLKKAIGDGKGFAVIGGFLGDVKKIEAIRAALLSALEAFHKKSPLEAGMNEGELFKAAAPKEKKGLLKEILEGLIADRKVKREGNAVALSAHRPASAGADAKIEGAIMALFNGGFAQPAVEDLKKLPFKKPDLDRVFLYLQRSGRIVRLKEGSFISAVAVSEAREKLRAYLKTRPNIKAAEFRDLLGCGRKLAIEILEYFDKEKVTIRQGDLRVLR